MGIINSGKLALASSEYFMYGIFLYIKVNQIKTRLLTPTQLKSLKRDNMYSQDNSCYHRIKTFTYATDRYLVIREPLSSLSCLRGSVLYLQVTLTGTKITFNARFFNCSSSCSDNAIPVSKRISWLVCTVHIKAYLRE